MGNALFEQGCHEVLIRHHFFPLKLEEVLLVFSALFIDPERSEEIETQIADVRQRGGIVEEPTRETEYDESDEDEVEEQEED